jgi:ribosome-binding factor A
MPAEFSRPRRVAEQIKREIAPLLQRFAQDERLGLLTVTAVDVTADLRDARVFVTHLGSGATHAELISRLNADSGRYRRHLAKALRLRATPSLAFLFDESTERSARIAALLDRTRAPGAPDDGES